MRLTCSAMRGASPRRWARVTSVRTSPAVPVLPRLLAVEDEEILRLVLEFAVDDGAGNLKVREKISRQDLAKMVGASREVCVLCRSVVSFRRDVIKPSPFSGTKCAGKLL